jgi:hypothetical protein
MAGGPPGAKRADGGPRRAAGCPGAGQLTRSVGHGFQAPVSDGRQIARHSYYHPIHSNRAEKTRRTPKHMGGENGFGFRRAFCLGGCAVSLGGEDARGNGKTLSHFRPQLNTVITCARSRKVLEDPRRQTGSDAPKRNYGTTLLGIWREPASGQSWWEPSSDGHRPPLQCGVQQVTGAAGGFEASAMRPEFGAEAFDMGVEGAGG